jgi:hypothetical protein
MNSPNLEKASLPEVKKLSSVARVETKQSQPQDLVPKLLLLVPLAMMPLATNSFSE